MLPESGIVKHGTTQFYELSESELNNAEDEMFTRLIEIEVMGIGQIFY